MKIGERVTGVPANPPIRKKYLTVTGYYDESQVKAHGVEFTVQFVVVGGQHIDCTNIRPANRREQDTERVSA